VLTECDTSIYLAAIWTPFEFLLVCLSAGQREPFSLSCLTTLRRETMNQSRLTSTMHRPTRQKKTGFYFGHHRSNANLSVPSSSIWIYKSTAKKNNTEGVTRNFAWRALVSQPSYVHMQSYYISHQYGNNTKKQVFKKIDKKTLQKLFLQLGGGGRTPFSKHVHTNARLCVGCVVQR